MFFIGVKGKKSKIMKKGEPSKGYNPPRVPPLKKKITIPES
jgi:hypothetical protein